MGVVHGLVTADGAIACWAEATRSGPAGRRTSLRRAVPHPFAVDPAVPGETGTAELHLPSAGSSPLASPELGSTTKRRGAVRILPWTVPIVVPPPGADLENVVAAPGGDLGDGHTAGSSIGWVADVRRLADYLVQRGRVLPAIVDHQALWRAVLSGADQARYELLWRAMPGVAKAATPTEDAATVTRKALDHAVDARVRAILTEPLVASGEGLVREWLTKLTGPETTIQGEVEGLRRRLDHWADSGRPAPVRTCFRLSYDEEDGWELEFLLQPVDEPSLLVPAEHVWRDTALPLMRWVDDPQAVLLADLGRASRLYPDLDDVLRSPYPSVLALDLAGAYRFLTHASVLEDAGFGVLVPAVWQRRQDLGLTLTVRSAEPAAPVLRDNTANRDAIVKYRWGLALGQEFLSEEDLVELARAKVPLVRLRGRWVHLDQERLRKGLAFLARGGTGEMTAGEAMRFTHLVPEELPLPVTGVDGTGWLADLLTGRAVDRLELVDPPASLKTELRQYQKRGLAWLVFLDRVGVGALLADDMGLGKTVQVLALEALQREEAKRNPTLIVCPMSVLANWRREIERFTPSLTVHVHHGPGRALPDDVDLVLTTYQLAVRDEGIFKSRQWERLVLDEAQHVKNATAGVARAVRRIEARHRVALTGTPVENRLTELWSIADFLNPGILGPASIFRARYSVPIERFADPDAAARLRRVTRPFLLRRVKTDKAVIADLPEKVERTQWCNLTVEQATLYRAVVDEMFVKLKEGRAGSRRKALVLSAMTKLKQVCNHPAHLLGDGSALANRSGKLERLEEILENALADGDRTLVFTQFARFGAMLAPYLADRLGTEVAYLHGGVAEGARAAMVERFQNGGPKVFLLSLKAGGTGLNLTAANHVVHLDRWWNPATEAQATDRAYRIGQRRDVQVHTFVCAGTVEERIDTIMTEKRALARSAIGSGEGWLTGLSTDDLLDLVTLSNSVVTDG